MSDAKLKLVDQEIGSEDQCHGCFYYNQDIIPCPDTGCFGCDYLDGKDRIWVIDGIKTDEPKDAWVKIEDAELVDGEWYWCLLKDGSATPPQYFLNSSSGFLVGVGFWAVNRFTHVIHLPAPQAPKL